MHDVYTHTRAGTHFAHFKRGSLIKAIKYILITLAVIAAALYGASLLLRLEAVQQRAARAVTLALQEFGDLPISIGAVQVQHLNKVVVKRIAITDEKGDTAVDIPKITAHLSPIHMLKGDIRINTLMIGEPTITLSRNTATSPLNIQFIIDKLTGDSTAEKSSTPHLRINHIQMYDGTLTYDIEEAERKEDTFDPSHIKIEELTCNLSLKKLTSDTLSLYIRSISGQESKGFRLDRLSAKVNANSTHTEIKELLIELPQSRITAKRAAITPQSNGTLAINGTLHGKELSLADFASFLPTLASAGLPTIEFKASIGGNNRKTEIATSISTSDKSAALQTNARIDGLFPPHNCTVSIDNGTFTTAAIEHLQTILNDSTGTLAPLKQLGHISLRGKATAKPDGTIESEFAIDSEGGNIQGSATIDEKQECKATLDMQGIELGRILKNDKFGACDIATDIQGNTRADEQRIAITSTVSSFSYNGYTYFPIAVSAAHDKEQTIAAVYSSDPNATGHITCTYTHSNKNEIKITASIDSIKPDSLHIGAGDNGKVSATIDGTYNRYDGDKSLFDLRIYNITQQTGRKKKNIRLLHIVDNNLLDNRSLIINSDFLDARIAGRFTYPSLAGTFKNIARTHLPALAPEKPVPTDNAYAFNLNIKNTAVMSNLLDLPVTIHNRSTIIGQCDDDRKLFHADIKLTDTDIDGHRFDSISTTLFANDSIASINGSFKTPGSLTINLHSTARDNNIKNSIDWENDTTPVNRGTIEAVIALARAREGVEAEARIAPGKIVYNSTPWEISGCNIKGNANEVTIENLHIAGENKSLFAHGRLGKTDDDILDIKLNDIKIETILDLADFHSVEFGGAATGNITLSRAFDNPQFSSRLQVDSFTFEKGYMGDLTFNAEWKEEEKAVAMRGDIHTPDKAHTIVRGIVSPANDTLNLCIDADRTRIAFLNSMLDDIVSDVNATVTGQVHLLGPLGHLNLVGEAIANGPLRIDATNVTYMLINDTIKLTPNRLSLNNSLIADQFGHAGFVTGNINHKELGDWTCDLDIKANNLLAYHCEEFGPNPFHGTAFATGDANITANDKGLFIHADIRSERNSLFVYDASNIGGSTGSNFIKFNDRNKKRLAGLQREEEEPEEEPDRRKSLLSRLNLEFMIDITPDMQLKVYTNRKAGDYIDLYGRGPITAVYDEKDGFTMQGLLDLERGTYKFTMQDIFPKEFDITEGSTLEFNGDPFQAALNLKTRYLVPSASLSDLDPTGKRHKSVKVHCLMDITGKLEAPQLNFDIELPDANEEQRELLASAVSTPEQKNMQFIYLMGIGKFYTYDYNRTEGSAESSSAMESLISNTISGQLNNMLSRIIDNRNWNISGNFSSSERGWNSMEVEGILEGRLLDNRLLINGNFGYRENPLANSNFVGDFEVQWLLDRNGNVSLKAYNKTNDRYFSDATLTTQGAGIILRHNFDEWRWWLRNKKEREKQETEK